MITLQGAIEKMRIFGKQHICILGAPIYIFDSDLVRLIQLVIIISLKFELCG